MRSPQEPPGPDGSREFYGGDLFGVLEALPYL
jgi:alpha-glucosidase